MQMYSTSIGNKTNKPADKAWIMKML